MNRTAARIVLLSALILSVLSCSEPLSTETFVLNQNGKYSFEVDMTHTDCAYDLFFYSRVDSWRKVPEFPIDIVWTSPSGQRYSERVYFVRDGHDKVAYRTGLIPVESGIWKLDAAADAEGLRGLGLICKRVY